MKKTIDELLQTEYWIIDILPVQVPKDSPGQYFAVERYFLRRPHIRAIKQKHINVILKLNCYRDLSLDEEAAVNPPPDVIAEAVNRRYVCILIDDSMIVSEPDSTYLTLYNPDEQLLSLVMELSKGEGLFVWKTPA
jgi:hypothetical protein